MSSSILSALKKLRTLLTREEKLKCVGIIVFALCTSILEVVTALLVVVFAQVLTQPQAGQHYLVHLHHFGLMLKTSPSRFVFYVSLIIGAVYLIKNGLMALEVFHQNFTIQEMNDNFKNRLLYRYVEADYEASLMRNSSAGVHLFQNEADFIFSSGILALCSIFSESLVFAFLVAMIIFMNPSLALIIFSIFSVLGIIIGKWLLPKFYRYGQRLTESTKYTYLYLMQFFHAFKEVILLGKRDAFINAYKVHSHKRAEVQAVQAAVNSLPRLIIEMLFIGIFVVTIAILCLQHKNSIQMTGILGAYLYAGFRLLPGLNRIINQLNNFKVVVPAIERVDIEYHSAAEKGQYLHLLGFKFEQNICVNGVNFAYMNTDKNALSQVSFEIKKSERIGIVGETGSGKSTLVDVLLGLLKPSQGSILIDNQYPVNSYEWHQKIGYVPQSIYLTDDTIAANIAFGEDHVDQERLKAAIDASQLRSLVDQLPLGIETIVGERGVRLSGGERQRIAIARALYRNPEVLIFDEATSALDTATEERLMETIDVVSQNRTVIMIAHRLTTLKNCDRIFMMDRGTICETSYHEHINKDKK